MTHAKRDTSDYSVNSVIKFQIIENQDSPNAQYELFLIFFYDDD